MTVTVDPEPVTPVTAMFCAVCTLLPVTTIPVATVPWLIDPGVNTLPAPVIPIVPELFKDATALVVAVALVV